MNIKAKIIQAVFVCTGVHGLLDLRIRHIAAQCGVAEGSIYRYFDSKDALLIECFSIVDHEIATLYDDIRPDSLTLGTAPRDTVRHLWLKYFNYLRLHPDKTIFYFHFKNSHYYSPELKKAAGEYYGGFIQVIAAFNWLYQMYDRIDPALFWEYIMDTTVSMVCRILRGNLPDSDHIHEQIFALLYDGLQTCFLSKGDIKQESGESGYDRQGAAASRENQAADYRTGSGSGTG